MAPQDHVPGVQRLPSPLGGNPTGSSGHSGHAPGELGGHDHPEVEAFPRLAVRDLIGASLSEEELRERWQTGALTLGLMLLALALPTEQLLGSGPALVQATDQGEWAPGPLGLQPIARLLSLLPAVGAERAWFLLSACCWAACYPVLTGMLRVLGIRRLAAGAATLVVLLSPAGQLTATLPGPSAAALLGSAILFRRLLTSAADAGSEARRTLSLWFVACLFHTSLVALLPAVLVHLSRRDAATAHAGRLRLMLRDAGIGLAALLALHGLASLGRPAGMGYLGFWERVGSGLLGSTGIGSPSSLTWLLMLGPAIGVGLLGGVELLRKPDGRSESRPPAWLWIFVGAPLLLQLLGARPSLEAAAWILSPALALGLASFFSRSQERGRTAFIVGLIGAQVTLTVSFRLTSLAGDANRPWTLLASELLEPGDLVITANQQHEYLLRHRFGLPTLNLRTPRTLGESQRSDWWERARETVRAQDRAGRGVWADWAAQMPLGGTREFAFPRELHELVLLAPVRYLDPGEPRVDTPAALPDLEGN